jgi:biopolymer transport protein ExbD
MKVHRSKRLPPTVPLSSISDIALLLLIFFVLTTEFVVRKSIRAELPSVTREKEKASEDLIQVVVEEDAVYLDAERLPMSDLAPFLAAKLANKTKPEDRAVILDAKSAVRYERVVQAANEIKRAGGIITIMKVED